jgi:hypothetical protein
LARRAAAGYAVGGAGQYVTDPEGNVLELQSRPVPAGA